MKKLTQKRLKELVSYNPVKGKFRRLVRTSNRIKISDPMGHINSEGYHVFKLEGRGYRAHRLAWLYMTGKWPRITVDHKNRKKTDNRWVNLREATKSQNAANSKVVKGKNPHRGVCFNKRIGKWHARIGFARKEVHLGFHDSLSAAISARNAGKRKYFGEFAAV